MPVAPPKRIPQYSRHKRSGQAIVFVGRKAIAQPTRRDVAAAFISMP
jgi:hypothetical protein